MRKILFTLLALVLAGVLTIAGLFVYGWFGIPQGQRDHLLGRETAAAAAVQAQIAEADEKPVSAPAAQAASPAIAIVSPAPIDQVVEAGGTASTPCFAFEVSVRSRVVGDGCRIAASIWTPGRAPGIPYITIETLSDDPPGIGLEAMGSLLIESMKARMEALDRQGRGTYRGENPGPYDTDFGKYLGATDMQMNGRPARALRWGLLPQKDVRVVDASCPAQDDRCAASPGLEAYRSVKINAIVALAPGRYTWDGNPQAWLLVTGSEKGLDWRAYQSARDSLRLR